MGVTRAYKPPTVVQAVRRRRKDRRWIDKLLALAGLPAQRPFSWDKGMGLTLAERHCA